MPVLVDSRMRTEVLIRAVARAKANLRRVEDPHFEAWRNDFGLWVQERLGEHVWSRQVQIGQSLVHNRRTAVPSAHDVGKSWLAGRAVCWWLDCNPPGSAFVVTTSSTGAQVKAILWREINRAHAKGKLPGRTNRTEWWIAGEMVAYGRKPAEYNATAFQGIHARRVLVVIDEACGVPKTIFDAAGSLAANEGSRILATGNPDDPQSHFEAICRPDSGWSVVPIDGYDSPNFSGEPIPEDLSDLLLSKTYERELARDEGCSCASFEDHVALTESEKSQRSDRSSACAANDSPVYTAKVRGVFKADDPEGVVPVSWARRCQRLELPEETLVPINPNDPYGPKKTYVEVSLGVDVGAGGDETSVRERRGPVAGRAWHRRTPDWKDSVLMVLDAIELTGASIVNIDSNGIGWGTYGRLVELQQEGKLGSDIVITAVNVGERSSDPTKFPLLRDQLWWEVGRELSRLNAWDLATCDDKVIAQLCAPKFTRLTNGMIKVEPKAETKKRILRSPDDADALLLAYFKPPQMTAWRL